MKINRIFFTVLYFSFCFRSFAQTRIDEIYDYHPHNIDALELINHLNNSVNAIDLRSDFKIKNDSIHFYRLEQGNLDLDAKLEFIYDKENKKEITLSFSRTLSSWSPRGYSVLTFNKKNQLIRQTYSLWNGDYNNLNEYNPIINRNYFYNLNEKADSILVQNADAINQDIPHQKYVYIYDSSDNLLSITENWWSTESNSFYSTFKVEYQYDNQANVTEIVRLNFENNSWVPRDSTILHYDERENLILKDVFAVISNPGQLDPYTHDIYHYNTDDQLIMKDEYSLFHIPSNQWWDIRVKEYDYDNLGNFVLMTKYDSITIQYERELNLTEKNIYNSDHEIGDVQFPRSTFLFIQLQDEPNFSQFNPIELIEKESGGGVTSIKRLFERTKYFYSDISTSNVNLIEDSNIKVFPNPCKDFIQFDLSNNKNHFDVKLLDAKGQLVKRGNIYSGERIDVSELKTGVYIYRINNGDNLYTGRIVKL